MKLFVETRLSDSRERSTAADDGAGETSVMIYLLRARSSAAAACRPSVRLLLRSRVQVEPSSSNHLSECLVGAHSFYARPPATSFIVHGTLYSCPWSTTKPLIPQLTPFYCPVTTRRPYSRVNPQVVLCESLIEPGQLSGIIIRMSFRVDYQIKVKLESFLLAWQATEYFNATMKSEE